MSKVQEPQNCIQEQYFSYCLPLITERRRMSTHVMRNKIKIQTCRTFYFFTIYIFYPYILKHY